VNGIASWDDAKLLTVKVDRLQQWHRPGLLCIGDAAHAMSPVGGVGINLAVQDAVAAANILWSPLLHGRLSVDDLQAVQRRRELPTRITQRVQVFVQKYVLFRTISGRGPTKLLWPLRLLNRFPILRRIPARFVGLGVRAEHVRSPAA
jgi:2-polyprenyl-6-methoxyphenol hydroxylase-like FAD-dependent oxidoreductase